MKRVSDAISPQILHSIKSLTTRSLYPQALNASAHLRSPHLTDTIYALLIKSGFALDPFQAASLITHFSLGGDFSRSTKLLGDTHRPDTVVYNSLLSGYARFGQTEPCFILFNRLRKECLNADEYTLSSLIKVCDSLEQNQVAHGVSLKMGFASGLFLVSGLIENYSKWGLVDSAEKCFGGCLVPDSVVWTAMINGYVMNGELEKGRDVFMEMRSFGMELNEFSLTSVLGALFEIKEGEQVHGISLKMGFLYGRSTHLNNAVMVMYCRFGSKVDAIKVFDEISDPDVVSWTGRIGAAYDGGEAFGIFKLCCSIGVEINEYTVSNALSAIEGTKLLKPGKQIHALCYKAGYLEYVSNPLISMYGKCGQMGDAKRVFDEMICQDSVSWNSLMSGYSEGRLVSEAILIFSQMRDSLVQPNKYSLASILDVVSNSNSPRHALQIHSLIIKLGFGEDDSMLCCLITAYGKCNSIDKSMKVFSEIGEVNVVHLNAMAATLLNAGYHVYALKLFQSTWRLSFEVDGITFSMVLKACCTLTDLEQVRTIHSLALKSGTEEDKFVQSAVIDAYCKCGSIDDAENAFRYPSKGNLAAWNAMMMGYAQRGCYHEVLDLFGKMHEFGMKPDEITYLAVLSSCCHAGLLNEARRHLRSMYKLHGMIPCLEHYACMVDMFGRIGLLEDAKRTIDHMPIIPDAQIWQILLSACNIHGNVDLGKVAARKLLELQPENDSAYVLLSNLYASAGMWDEVRKMRTEMKEKIVSKEPGFSWIQVRGCIHYFFASDLSHPESKEIHMNLQSLMKQTRPLPNSDQNAIFSIDRLIIE